ncbi:MAG: hypothetical protein RLZZ618_1041 [Pseudomonadota bacterium]|jgi:hypothetical protein
MPAISAGSNFVIWGRAFIDGACALRPMTGYPDDWKLINGEAVTGEFPEASQFQMNPDYPGQNQLTDSLYNLDTLIVASRRLQALLEASSVAQMEYLPVNVVDQKGRRMTEPYVIAHPLNPVDCLVIDACQPRWGRIDKNDISRLKHLVIDESRIPADRLLFRPKHYKSEILVHRALAEKIDAAGYTGARWIELADYPEP